MKVHGFLWGVRNNKSSPIMVMFAKLKKEKFYSLALCRDFNEIIRSHEKIGGRQRPARQMEDFREVLDECGFRDLGFVGGKFT